MLTLLNAALTFYLAPKIGRLISYIGERRTLTLEYIGLYSHLRQLRLRGHHRNRDRTVSARPYVLCHGDCHQDLFSEDRRPSRYCRHVQHQLHHQSHSGSRTTGSVGLVWVINHSAVFLIGARLPAPP